MTKIKCAVHIYRVSCTEGCSNYWGCRTISERAAQRILDNMEQFYNPRGFAKEQKRKKRESAALQKIFVGGLPFD